MILGDAPVAKIVNLRQARKQRAREEARAEATARAAKHGRSKAQVEAETKQAQKAEHLIQGHFRDRDPE